MEKQTKKQAIKEAVKKCPYKKECQKQNNNFKLSKSKIEELKILKEEADRFEDVLEKMEDTEFKSFIKKLVKGVLAK